LRILDAQARGSRHLDKAKPRFIEPMKAKLVEKPPTTGDWLYELKFDGIRLIAIKNGQKVSIPSRNQNEQSGRFPDIVEAIETLPVRECVIDGEVVALDEEGRSSFQLLQGLEMEGRKNPVYFYAFDLLQVDGKSLLNLPLEARKMFSKESAATQGTRSVTRADWRRCQTPLKE
jgi:bifunctional non-homologous end joining protein LigD